MERWGCADQLFDRAFARSGANSSCCLFEGGPSTSLNKAGRWAVNSLCSCQGCDDMEDHSVVCAGVVSHIT